MTNDIEPLIAVISLLELLLLRVQPQGRRVQCQNIISTLRARLLDNNG